MGGQRNSGCVEEKNKSDSYDLNNFIKCLTEKQVLTSDVSRERSERLAIEGGNKG